MKKYMVSVIDSKGRKITYFAPNLRQALTIVYRRKNCALSVNGKMILKKGKS